MTPALRKKRIWSVADFALHAYNDASEAACRRARRFLKRLDEKHAGQLLIPSKGTNRDYSFVPTTLARLEPDLFEPLESLEMRFDALEDDVGELRLTNRRIISQVGQNTRAIERLRTRRPAA